MIRLLVFTSPDGDAAEDDVEILPADLFIGKRSARLIPTDRNPGPVGNTISLKGELFDSADVVVSLEAALLDAVWAEVVETGYEGFTIGAVARAETSAAVLYRRWAGKQEPVHAAIVHALDTDPVTAPDTGSLRSDVIGW